MCEELKKLKSNSAALEINSTALNCFNWPTYFQISILSILAAILVFGVQII